MRAYRCIALVSLTGRDFSFVVCIYDATVIFAVIQCHGNDNAVQAFDVLISLHRFEDFCIALT